MMRATSVLALLLLAAPPAEIRYFHFERPVQTPAQSAGQTCLVVDPGVYFHAAPGLADLRLYQGTTETAYELRSDVPIVSTDQTIPLLNLGRAGNQTVFDAEMPEGHYSDLQLKVTGHDFLATVKVSGSQSQTDSERTTLGAFTVFDLSSQRLGRSTVLHLPESDFRFLHFQIAGPITPQDVTGLSITRLPESRPKYLTVAETATPLAGKRDSVFVMDVFGPPVDRLVVVPGAMPPNFSRDVEIRVDSLWPRGADDGTEPPQAVTASGNILRVHSIENGHRIDEDRLVVDAPESSFAGQRWTITILNRDDAPIQIASVRLEMLERRLCFDAAVGAAYTLYYGDSALAPPRYDYASLFVMERDPIVAKLGTETANPAWRPRPDERPFTEKHPVLLWIALVLVIALLVAVAFRSFKSASAKPLPR
jgi:hypothetical protein